MRRLLATSLLLTALATLLPSPARAGGNWIEFRRPDGPSVGGSGDGGSNGDVRARWDIFATGETVVARVGYLSRIFDEDDGPFHLYIEQGAEVEVGEPIPSTALRVGTFTMSQAGRGGWVRFVLPELAKGSHTFSICDDPCTTWGFDEYVQGWLTSVPTVGEAQLLARFRQQQEDYRELFAELHDDARKAERGEDAMRRRVTQLENDLHAAREQAARLSGERAATRPSALIDGAGGAWIASGTLAIAAGWLIVRRRRGILVPDTPAELMPLEPKAGRTVRSERVLEDLDV